MPRHTLHLLEQAEDRALAFLHSRGKGVLGRNVVPDQAVWSGNKEVPWNFTFLKNHVMGADRKGPSLYLQPHDFLLLSEI